MNNQFYGTSSTSLIVQVRDDIAEMSTEYVGVDHHQSNYSHNETTVVSPNLTTTVEEVAQPSSGNDTNESNQSTTVTINATTTTTTFDNNVIVPSQSSEVTHTVVVTESRTLSTALVSNHSLPESKTTETSILITKPLTVLTDVVSTSHTSTPAVVNQAVTSSELAINTSEHSSTKYARTEFSISTHQNDLSTQAFLELTKTSETDNTRYSYPATISLNISGSGQIANVGDRRKPWPLGLTIGVSVAGCCVLIVIILAASIFIYKRKRNLALTSVAIVENPKFQRFNAVRLTDSSKTAMRKEPGVDGDFVAKYKKTYDDDSYRDKRVGSGQSVDSWTESVPLQVTSSTKKLSKDACSIVNQPDLFSNPVLDRPTTVPINVVKSERNEESPLNFQPVFINHSYEPDGPANDIPTSPVFETTTAEKSVL
ncbi:unnamed protein product [Owenia fusiformis]|uniref:Uncharacterized protein n=1 Tax=Owenia fusiformis TaxID=6347 RepID=A0A8J1UA34_OWEFU|nr:unnamed protein product [Owenia fusiformis]